MTTLTPDVLKLHEASEVAGMDKFVRGALSTRLRRREVVPDYDSNRPHTLAVRGGGSSSRVNHSYLVAQTPDREMVEARLGLSAYLQLFVSIAVDQSHSRILHLMKRPDTSRQGAYSDFRACEDMVASLPVRRMSRLTRKMLPSIVYEFVRMRRTKISKRFTN